MTADDKIKLGDLFSIRKEPGSPGSTLMSVTINYGLVERGTLDRKTDTALAPEEHLAIRKGDIAYNMMRMWQGAFGLADHDGIVSPAYVVVFPKDGIDPKFAYYWFKSPRMIHQFWAYSYGLTKDRLRLYSKDFSLIPVDRPPSLDHQKRIVDMMIAWENATETIHQIVKHKRRLKEGLIKRLLTGQKRFPRFGEPPQGKSIPPGWRFEEVGSLVDSISGGVSPSCDNRPARENEKGVLQLSSLNHGLFRPEENKVVLSEQTTSLGPHVRKNTILVSRSNTLDLVGACAFIPEDFPNLHIPDLIWEVAVNPDSGCDPRWLAYQLCSLQVRRRLKQVAAGTSGSMKKISRPSFRSIKIMIPPEEEQTTIIEFLSDLDDCIGATQDLCDATKKEREGISHRLFSNTFGKQD